MNPESYPIPPDDRHGPWRIVRLLIRLVVPERYREEFLGDLIEEYEALIRPQWGPGRSSWWLWRQAFGSVIPMLRLRLEEEMQMFRTASIRSLVGARLSTEVFDSRFAQVACSLAGVAIVPMAILALFRNQGGGAEFLLGIGLAIVAGLIFLMMGFVIRLGVTRLSKVPLRRRWVEFVGYLGCLGTMNVGIRALPALGLSPAGIVLGLLVVIAVSNAILLLGYMSNLLLARERRA